VKPNKEDPHSANKIDGIIAVICAMATMMQTPDKPKWDKYVFSVSDFK